MAHAQQQQIDNLQVRGDGGMLSLLRAALASGINFSDFANKDLSVFSLPAALMVPLSVVELQMLSRAIQTPLLHRAALAKTPEERMCHMLASILAPLQLVTVWGKKPFNPVLGEHLSADAPGGVEPPSEEPEPEARAPVSSRDASWYDRLRAKPAATLDSPTATLDSPTARLTVEQVSHHPPVTAWSIDSRSAGVVAQGYVQLLPRFKFTHMEVAVSSTSRVTLSVRSGPGEAVDEHYVTGSFPPLLIRGILGLGQRVTEFVGRLEVACEQSGLEASVSIAQSAGAAKPQAVSGTVSRGGELLCRLEGSLPGELRVTPADGAGSWELLSLARLEPLARLPALFEVTAESRAHGLCSHRVWAELAEAILAKDWPAAAKAKRNIEQAQRDRGDTVQLRHFERAAPNSAHGLLWKSVVLPL